MMNLDSKWKNGERALRFLEWIDSLGKKEGGETKNNNKTAQNMKE